MKKKMNFYSYLTPYIEIKSKWIIGLTKLKPGTIKLLD